MKILNRFILILLMFISISFQCIADDLSNDELYDFSSIEVFSQTADLNLSSKYAIVLERSSLTALFEKNAYEKTPMASTTKIMTAILALENSELTDTINISKKAANTGGSTLGITSNSNLSMESLLYGLLLRSGNDCAVAIAEYIGGNLENFAKMMNEKAKLLGLRNTNFVTPHGLDNENHYTTAYDLALLTDYALKNETFLKIVGTKSITISVGNIPRTIENTNELLRKYRRSLWS